MLWIFRSLPELALADSLIKSLQNLQHSVAPLDRVLR